MTSLRLITALFLLSALTACGDDPCAGVGMSWGVRGERNTVDDSCGGSGRGGGAEPCNQVDPSDPNYRG